MDGEKILFLEEIKSRIIYFPLIIRKRSEADLKIFADQRAKLVLITDTCTTVPYVTMKNSLSHSVFVLSHTLKFLCKVCREPNRHGQTCCCTSVLVTVAKTEGVPSRREQGSREREREQHGFHLLKLYSKVQKYWFALISMTQQVKLQPSEAAPKLHHSISIEIISNGYQSSSTSSGSELRFIYIFTKLSQLMNLSCNGFVHKITFNTTIITIQ